MIKLLSCLCNLCITQHLLHCSTFWVFVGLSLLLSSCNQLLINNIVELVLEGHPINHLARPIFCDRFNCIDVTFCGDCQVKSLIVSKTDGFIAGVSEDSFTGTL